jgi:hypothetical protein
MTVQKAVAFLSSKKRTLKLLSAGLRNSFLGAAVELFGYRYNAVDGLPTP